jgi:hypothetical protein
LREPRQPEIKIMGDSPFCLGGLGSCTIFGREYRAGSVWNPLREAFTGAKIETSS